MGVDDSLAPILTAAVAFTATLSAQERRRARATGLATWLALAVTEHEAHLFRTRAMGRVIGDHVMTVPYGMVTSVTVGKKESSSFVGSLVEVTIGKKESAITGRPDIQAATCHSLAVNDAHKALLARLRELVDETPGSGALNLGRRPLHINRFSQAVEARADDGPALVAYIRSKVHEPATSSYSALIEAGRPDLTAEAVVADAAAPWASEFTDADRSTARARLGAMLEAHRRDEEAVEAEAVQYDRKIVADVSASRVAKGKPPLTPEQEQEMLADRAARRAAGT
jgi:hypothetical protein